MQHQKVVILGTGGTIAGTSSGIGSAADNIHYTAAQVSASQLVEAIPALSRGHLLVEQVAQTDSKDMSFALWVALAERVQHHLALDDVQAVVITHGTDTLEETAYFLQALLSPSKPVVLTCAMRPADALAPDGPQNILDAITVARNPNAQLWMSKSRTPIGSMRFHLAMPVRSVMLRKTASDCCEIGL